MVYASCGSEFSRHEWRIKNVGHPKTRYTFSIGQEQHHRSGVAIDLGCDLPNLRLKRLARLATSAATAIEPAGSYHARDMPKRVFRPSDGIHERRYLLTAVVNGGVGTKS